ncbi:hypothetical protein HHI36_023000 [Cryptolaemus montrouzieri]|uniref:Uncharacterized protein n=1 Tax=Cryptolaemus montrouzieri TaxID=559131 RepID=A0ABD2PFQ8_9CUCU
MLNWRKHITYLSGNLSSICYSLSIIGQYLSAADMIDIYYAIFESRVRYGIIFWGRSAGLLTLAAIYIQECLLFVFKHKDLFEKKIVTTYNTRTTSLKYPQHRLSKTEEDPEYACVTFYNKLTPQIRSIRLTQIQEDDIQEAT